MKLFTYEPGFLVFMFRIYTCLHGLKNYLLIQQKYEVAYFSPVLVVQVLLQNATDDRMNYKPQKFIYRSSGGWVVHNQGINRFGVW